MSISKGINILIGPDLHCWPTTYECAPRGTIPSRLVEWRNIKDEILNVALKHSAKYALFPGDLFNIASPKAEAVIEIINLFEGLEKNGCKVIACKGNHDDVGPTVKNFVDVLSEYNPLWGITEIGCYNFEELSIAVIPYQKPTLLDRSGSPEKVSEALVQKAREMANHCSGYKVLMGHWSIKEAIYANGFGPKNEPVFPLADLKEMGYNICAMGHVHKAQVLNEKPLIFHPGVSIITKMDEKTETPSVFVVNTKTNSYILEELPAKKIEVFELTKDSIVNFESGEWKKDIPEIENCIVVGKYTATEDEARKVDHKEIINYLREKGAFYVEGIRPTIIRKERDRGATIDTSLSRVEAFNKWYDTTTERQDLKSKVLLKFQELEKEIEN